MNKYHIFFIGNSGSPGLEMIVTGYDMPSVVNQYQWSGPGPIIRIELVGSTNVQDMSAIAP